jgi:hypothetical protein
MERGFWTFGDPLEVIVSYLKELQNVIWTLHGVASRHVESVPVKETFHGQTVWEGVVEVFELTGHPKASRVYAWSHVAGDPDKPKRHVTVLHIAPVLSATMAVRAAIREEFRSYEQEKT